MPISKDAEGVVQFGLSLRALFPQAFAAFCVAFLGTIFVLHRRDWLVGLVATRRRRVLFEALPLAGINGGAALLAGAVEWKAVFATKGSTLDMLLIWGLALLGGLAFAFQAFALVHADLAAEVKVQADKAHAHHLKKLQKKFDRDLVGCREELASVRDQRDTFALVNMHFLHVVGRKRDRLLSAGTANGLAALNPHTQTQYLVNACWQILHDLVNKDREVTARARVRVAYFRVIENRLTPVRCWDGESDACISGLVLNDPLTRSRFDLDAREGCLATAASRSGTPYWVPCAEDAHSDPDHPFVFFDGAERKTLKSIVALPIVLPGLTRPFDVIVVDTDVENHFHEGNGALGVVLNNLAHRLQLEKAVEAIVPEG